MSNSQSYIWTISKVIYGLDHYGFFIHKGFEPPIVAFLTLEEAREYFIHLNGSMFRSVATKEWFGLYYNSEKEGSLAALEAGGLESEWGAASLEANEGIRLFYQKWKIKDNRSISKEDLDALDDSAIFLLSNLLDIRFYIMSKAKIIC
jgi:hypothetical protein